jgi:hypothetical protein
MGRVLAAESVRTFVTRVAYRNDLDIRMAEQSGQMSAPYDFAGPDDSDSQFVIVFVAHTITLRRPNLRELHLTMVWDGCSTRKSLRAICDRVSRSEFCGFGQELAMFSPEAMKEWSLKQGTP